MYMLMLPLPQGEEEVDLAWPCIWSIQQMEKRVSFNGPQEGQTSMATSAPEAEVSAMAEGFAASIFLFDTLSEIGLVSGSGPSSIMSMKTDSAVALKQLGTQSVTVRTRTAAQKLNYLRELIYDDPQIEPIYISGDSQRADGLTKRSYQEVL